MTGRSPTGRCCSQSIISQGPQHGWTQDTSLSGHWGPSVTGWSSHHPPLSSIPPTTSASCSSSKTPASQHPSCLKQLDRSLTFSRSNAVHLPRLTAPYPRAREKAPYYTLTAQGASLSGCWSGKLHTYVFINHQSLSDCEHHEGPRCTVGPSPTPPLFPLWSPGPGPEHSVSSH